MNLSSLTSPAPLAFANTIAEFEPPVAPPHRLVLPVGFALFAVLAVGGVCGNSFLLRAIARRSTSTSYSLRGERAGGYVSASGAHAAATETLLGLLRHAAIANLATTACPLPLSLLELVLHRVGSSASLLCHVAQLALLVCFVASACLHVALALHLVKPRCDLRRVRCCAWRSLAPICWALAAVSAVPMLVSMLLELLEFVTTSDTYRREGSNAEQEAMHFCLEFPMPAHQLYFSAALSAVFLFSCVAMIIMYSAALSERKNAVRNLSRHEHRMQSFIGERLNTQSSGRMLRERVAQYHSAHSSRTQLHSHSILPLHNCTGIDASTAASAAAESAATVHPAVAILRREVGPTLSIGSNSTVLHPLCGVDSTGSAGGGNAAIDPEADWRTARVLATVAILFVCCWTPLVTLLTKRLQFALNASSFSRSPEEYVFTKVC